MVAKSIPHHLKPWHDESPCRYQQTMVFHGFKVVRKGFVHPEYVRQWLCMNPHTTPVGGSEAVDSGRVFAWACLFVEWVAVVLKGHQKEDHTFFWGCPALFPELITELWSGLELPGRVQEVSGPLGHFERVQGENLDAGPRPGVGNARDPGVPFNAKSGMGFSLGHWSLLLSFPACRAKTLGGRASLTPRQAARLARLGRN